jgi:hypothetical protein
MKKKHLLILAPLLFNLYIFAQVPTISSFSPISGPIGTSVTITGTNFSATAANNIVYFGAVKATVINATPTLLTTIVPLGSTYKPITVTSSNLTAYSQLSFNVTFAGNNLIDTNSFAQNRQYSLGQNQSPFDIAIADIDGDGKPDVVSASLDYDDEVSYISVFKNTSVTGNIFLGNPIGFGAYIDPDQIAVGDLNGDGKPDVVIADGDPHTVSVYQNTSSAGVISFSRTDYQINYFTGGISYVSISDFDGDGKPDIVATSGRVYVGGGLSPDSTVFILKNISTPTKVSFAINPDGLGFYGIPINVLSGDAPSNVYTGDLDGDGKPDILLGNFFGSTVSVLQNTSTPGNFSFDTKKDYSVGGSPGDVAMADLDGDGKPDIVTVNFYSGTVSTLENISTSGNISFAAKKDYAFGQVKSPYSLTLKISDMDGDGKPDIVVFNTDSISILKNTSTVGNISFGQSKNYASRFTISGGAIADLDGDGRPDIICGNNDSSTVTLFKSQIGEPVPTQLCPPLGDGSITSNLTGTNYQWQIDVGNGFINIGLDPRFIGINAATLSFADLQSINYNDQLRCIVDGNFSDIYVVKFTDTWTGTIDTAWEKAGNWSCGSVPDSNTDVFINNGTVVLSSNASVRSLTVSPNASFTIVSPFNLIVTH